MNKDQLRLAAAIDITQRAAVRMRRSLSTDIDLLKAGLAAGDDDADENRLRALDAFVQRFQQLHEHIIHRLFTAIYRVDECGDRPPVTSVLLATFETRGIVRSARLWRERAELRNRLVHEYPLDPSDRAITLNAAIEQSQDMLDEIDLALDYVRSNNLLGDNHA